MIRRTERGATAAADDERQTLGRFRTAMST